jgi:hypothetical protein
MTNTQSKEEKKENKRKKKQFQAKPRQTITHAPPRKKKH